MTLCLNNYNKTRVPFIGHFEITRFCSYKCGFCYNFIEEKKELGIEQIFNLVDQFVRAGCLYLNISGGEPLSHPNFNKIYEYIVKAGIRVSIETNASLLDQSILNVFKRYPPDKVLISMYGASEDTHKKVTNSKINLKTVKQNILLLKSNDINISLRTPVTKDNYKELNQISQFARQNDFKFSYDPKIWWTQSGERRYHYRCTSTMVEKYKEKADVYKDLYEKLKDLEKRPYAIRQCHWGDNEFYVNPYGELHYCIVFWNNKYDLLKGSFKDAWDNWYDRYKAKGCIGRKLYSTNGECPSGHIYFNKELDASQKIEELLGT